MIYVIYDCTNYEGDTPFTAGSRVGYGLNDPCLPQYVRYIFEHDDVLDKLDSTLIETFPSNVRDYLLLRNLDYFGIMKYPDPKIGDIIEYYRAHDECMLLNEN